MAKLRHALTGAIYELQESGLVRVEENGRSGLFHPDGRWHSGELRSADPHLLGWIGGPRLEPRLLPDAANGGSPATRRANAAPSLALPRFAGRG